MRRSARLRRVIVLGASMGGVEALRQIFAKLQRGIDAAIVVAIHRSAGISVLPAILARESGYPAAEAQDGQALEGGRIYVTPPGLHTRVGAATLTVGMGPRENGHRPSIDVLFRSAAHSFGGRAIGVVLSGALDCGASGLLEIRRTGGFTVVQDPRTAVNPQMPKSAIELAHPDYICPPSAIGPLLARLVARPPRAGKRAAAARERLSPFVCPDCNGPIFASGDGFRCRVGHRFSAQTFVDRKEQRLESALWEALNVMQERAELSRRMAARARENGNGRIAAHFESRANDADENAAILRDVVYRGEGGGVPAEQSAAVERGRRNGGRRRKRSV